MVKVRSKRLICFNFCLCREAAFILSPLGVKLTLTSYVYIIQEISLISYAN